MITSNRWASMLAVLTAVSFLPAPAVAADDMYEPNDSLSAAHVLTGNPWLSGISGFGVQADSDFYSYFPPFASRLTVKCRFRHRAGNIDLRLWNIPSSTQFATAAGTGDTELLVADMMPASTSLAIEVTGANAGNVYDLWWRMDVSGVDDNYEPNNTRPNAYNLTAKEGLWLSQVLTPPEMGYQKDEDWYRIDVSPGEERVLVRCEFNHADGDINVALIDIAGNPIWVSMGTTDVESIDRAVPGSGTYYIQVYGGPGGNKGNVYDLWWDDIPEDDDPYEPNNSLIDAYHPGFVWANQPLSDLWTSGTLYDEDWFEIDIPPDNLRVIVRCTFTHADGDIAIQLFDAAMIPFGLPADTSNDYEYIDAKVPRDGTYYIRVFNPVSGGVPHGNQYNLSWTFAREDFAYPFAADPEGWTWFEIPGWPAPLHPSAGGSLEMTQTAGQATCYGAWESPKNPLNAPHPGLARVLRAKYVVRSSVDGPSCPGFRFRAISSHIRKGGPPFDPDFSTSDFFASHEVYYSTLDTFHIQGREPGTGAGQMYTVLYYPDLVFSLMDPEVVTYFTWDLVDLDSLENDSGSLFLDRVEIDTLPRAPVGAGLLVNNLSFTDFSGWTTGTKPLPGGSFKDTGLDVTADSSGLVVTVAKGSEWFEAYAVSPAQPLTAGDYYRTIFTITSTETGGGDFGPTVRAGFASSKFVFSALKNLSGGSANARFGPTPKELEIWMQAPTADPPGGTLTEPIGLRFQSYLTDSNSGWPFFTDVSGTVRCTAATTENFGSP